MIRPTERLLPDNTQCAREANINAPDKIQTYNPSKWGAADPCYRPHDHRDWHSTSIMASKNRNNIRHLYYDSNTSIKPLGIVQINLTVTCKSLTILAEHIYIQLTHVFRQWNDWLTVTRDWNNTNWIILSCRLQGTGREVSYHNLADTGIAH